MIKLHVLRNYFVTNFREKFIIISNFLALSINDSSELQFILDYLILINHFIIFLNTEIFGFDEYWEMFKTRDFL